MDSQQTTTNVTKTTELTDLEDRSRFLKSLGFARDRMVQGSAAVQNNGPSTSDNGTDDNGMVLSSNFDDDLDVPNSPVLMDSTRSISEPFGLGKIDLGNNAHVEDVLEIETRFAEETSFDLAGIDDAAWEAVSYRLRPEPADWREAEAMLEADLKKKTVQTAFSEPITNSVSETRNNPKPPPLPEDDPIDKVIVESSLDHEIEKAAEPPSNDDEPPRDESLTVNCPSCGRGLTLQPEHLGIPGSCVWCETPIIAATSGVDQTVGVFELAVEKPEVEDISESSLKPTADVGNVTHSKLADLPTQKTSAPQVEAPTPEPVEAEKVAESEVTLPLTAEISKAETEEKPPVASIEEPEAKAEQPSIEPEAKEEAPADIETTEAIPEPKNNFPWNAPTAPKKDAPASKLVPTPIEVESELLLDEITDPELEEKTNSASAKAAAPLEVISEHKKEEKPNESKKEPLPPIDSPLPELDTAALSSWKEPAATPSVPPVEAKEETKQESPVAEPIQAASPFDSPAESEKKEDSEKTPAPIRAVSPFDPIPNTTETPESSATAEESKPTSFSAASPFGPPPETKTEAEVAPSTKADTQKSSATPEESKPTSFSAVSPFGSPAEDTKETEAAPPANADTQESSAAPEESKPTSFSAASPFGPPPEATTETNAAPSVKADTEESSTAPEESKPTSFSAASPFGPPPETKTESEAPPSATAKTQDSNAAPEESNPSSFSAASPFGPPPEATTETEQTVVSDSPSAAATPAFDSAPPKDDAATPTPLPWDQPDGNSSDSELPDLPPELSHEDDPDGPPIDVYPENEASLPPKDGPSAATISTKIEKPVRRKKSRSSKSSRTAITIALLGLISGAGIASFFLPIGGYIENAKTSWTEWFESKIGVENSWDQEALPSPTDEPVAIPAPDIPGTSTAPATAPTPKVTHLPASTASEDEPNPFESDKAPGS